MSKKKLSSDLTSKQIKFIHDKMSEDISNLDLESWQSACKSFGPFNYQQTTRKSWFEKNKTRVKIGKEIIRFFDTWAKNLRKEKILRTAKMTTIRKESIEAVRKAMDKQGLEKNKINDFKLATFRTLVSWSEDPSKLEEGPYEGMEKLPKDKKKRKSSRRGRKAAKGSFKAPEVDLVRSCEVKGNDLILKIVLINNYLHPYQNVELELDVDSKLQVQSVKDGVWVPAESRIRVGYLPASLEIEANEVIIEVHLRKKKEAKKYSIDGIIHFDNTEKGLQSSEDLKSSNIKL